MITVKCVEDDRGCIRLTIKGHSDSAPSGQDLICAGVTALAYGAAQAVQIFEASGMLRCAPEIRLETGDAEIVAFPVREYSQRVRDAIWGIQCGLQVLTDNFPECVQVLQYLHDYD